MIDGAYTYDQHKCETGDILIDPKGDVYRVLETEKSLATSQCVRAMLMTFKFKKGVWTDKDSSRWLRTRACVCLGDRRLPRDLTERLELRAALMAPYNAERKQELQRRGDVALDRVRRRSLMLD